MINNLSQMHIYDCFYKLQLSLKAGSDKITSQKYHSILGSEADLIIKKINNKTYKFSRYNQTLVKNNRLVYSPTIRDRIVLDLLKDSLIGKYKIKFQDRNKICEEINRTLENGFKFTILKLDITNFYNSIPHNLLYNKLKCSSLLSETEYLLVKRALSQSSKGVLQGLPISNCLAEIYLESFDKEMKSIDNRLCYFARYVDDVILIFNGFLLNSEISSIFEIINSKISKLGLSTNQNKTVPLLLTDNSSFDYLGYNFKLINPSLNNNKKNIGNKVSIEISSSKLFKIKDKINSYFDDYLSTGNFNLLHQRLTYISSSCYGLKFVQYSTNNVFNTYTKKISFGIYNSYKLASSASFKAINNYISYLVKKHSSNFTNNEKRNLFKCKFKKSNPHFINFHKFTNDDYASLIKKIDPTYIPPSSNARHTLIYDYFKLLNA